MDTRLSREVEFVRRSVLDGFKWAGTKLICRRAVHYKDFADGLAEHCPDCWDEVLHQSSNSRCPTCHGTGYLDGYGEPFMTWGSILENAQVDEDKGETAGLRTEKNMELRLPSEPIFSNGDVFAEVRRTDGDGVPTELGRIMKLDGPVRMQTVQGWVCNVVERRETRVEDIIVSQQGTVKLLLPSDDLYDTADDFFGLGVPLQPYVREATEMRPDETFTNNLNNWPKQGQTTP